MSSSLRWRKGVMAIPPVCVSQSTTGGIVPQEHAKGEGKSVRRESGAEAQTHLRAALSSISSVRRWEQCLKRSPYGHRPEQRIHYDWSPSFSSNGNGIRANTV